MTTPASSLPRKPSPRRNGGRSSHLSPDARAFVIERILLGDTNVQINAALRKAGHLPSGKGLSDVTLWTYRKSDAVRVNKELLTIEAQQVGHMALSAAIVYAVETLHSAADDLLGRSGTFGSSDLKAQRTAAYILFKAADFIWNRLGMEDPLGFNDKPAAHDAQAESLARANAEEKWKAEFLLAHKEAMNKLLRDLVARMEAEKGG